MRVALEKMCQGMKSRVKGGNEIKGRYHANRLFANRIFHLTPGKARSKSSHFLATSSAFMNFLAEENVPADYNES